MTKIAILGGTFDPIHIGHLILAEEAYYAYNLNRVIFMPAGRPPHKVGKSITPAEDRLKMVKLAVEDNKHFSVSDYELLKKGKSYTADTLRYLLSQKVADEIYFIIGADSLLDIFNWREPDFLLSNSQFIVAKRPGYPLESIFKKGRYKRYQDKIYFLPSKQVDISSTEIRERIKNGQPVKYYTRDKVIAYIREKGLYRGV